MQPVDLCLTPKWLLPIHPNNQVLKDHALLIHEGKILDMLPSDQAKARYQPKQTIDLPTHALLPGFVNTHTHTPMNLFKGLADDLQLMDWLTQHIWPAEKALINEESVLLGAKLAIAEMLRGGTTCFNDHYFFPTSIANAAIDCGIRAKVGMVVMSVPTEWAKDEATYFKKAELALETFSQHELISWAVAPHAPYTVSDSSFKDIVSFSKQHQLKVHIHLHETTFECEQSIKEFGVRPIERLNKLGLINERLIAVHMVDVNAEEISLMKNSQASVVHCPESNLKLASGFAPISAYLDAGINVSLATDGAASNNDLDMIGEMRTMSFAAKGSTNNPTVIPALEAIKIATYQGAKTLGLDQLIGSLEKGKQADCIAIDLSSPHCQPIYHPASQIVYSANAQDVSHVWVDGKPRLIDKEFVEIPFHQLIEKAHPIIEKARQYANT